MWVVISTVGEQEREAAVVGGVVEIEKSSVYVEWRVPTVGA